ncbi:MAG: hypothetical protein KF752_04615 [Pirellulaceae bacterium]|nr:hypothetical protein [Pirellulaceae bacterium]
MSRHACLVLSFIGLLLSFGAKPLPAGLRTFNVHLSGVDEFSGNTLRVFGTLTVDPAQPITFEGISSALDIQQNSLTPIQLPSNPNLVGQVSDNLA